MRPLWLLDVDGVLGAVEPKPKHRDAWGGYLKVSEVGLTITYAPALITKITELMELEFVEVQWLTTWQHDANTYLCPLFGWSELPVASTREEFLDETKYAWWKLATARRVAGDRPLIWTDDDLMDDAARRWVKERPWPTLAICPSFRGGIQPNEMAAIQDFCARHYLEEVGNMP